MSQSTKSITIRLTPEERDAIEAFAANSCRSMSSTVRYLVLCGLTVIGDNDSVTLENLKTKLKS